MNQRKMTKTTRVRHTLEFKQNKAWLHPTLARVKPMHFEWAWLAALPRQTKS